MKNEKAAEGGISLEECISVLENLKGRTGMYEVFFPHYPRDYIKRLVQTEVAALDEVISILKSREV